MDVVKIIRKENSLTEEVPEFDPANGNEKAKLLFLLEAPTPNEIESGIVAYNNPDPSARNFKKQLEQSGIRKEDREVRYSLHFPLGFRRFFA